MTTEERFARMESILAWIGDNRPAQDARMSALIISHIQTQEALRALTTEINRTDANRVK